MIHSGTNNPSLVPGGIIRPVVSVSVYFLAAGLLVPECIIRPVVSVSLYYLAAGLLFPEGSPAAK
jgi:hypothetical protein